MYGKSHSLETKNLIRISKKKYINGVGIYDLDNNLVKSFDYVSEIALYLSISKVTAGKYLNKGLIYKSIYYFKVNP